MALWRYCVREYPGVTGFSLGAFGGLAVYEATRVIYRFIHYRIGDDLNQTKPDKDFMLSQIEDFREAEVKDFEAVGRGIEAKLKALRASSRNRGKELEDKGIIPTDKRELRENDLCDEVTTGRQIQSIQEICD